MRRTIGMVFKGLVIDKDTSEILKKPIAEVESDTRIVFLSEGIFADDFEKFRDWLDVIIEQRHSGGW